MGCKFLVYEKPKTCDGFRRYFSFKTLIPVQKKFGENVVIWGNNKQSCIRTLPNINKRQLGVLIYRPANL